MQTTRTLVSAFVLALLLWIVARSAERALIAQRRDPVVDSIVDMALRTPTRLVARRQGSSLLLTWPRVRDATSFVVRLATETPIRIPGDTNSFTLYDSDPLREFRSLTDATIGPVPISVVALRGGDEISTFSVTIPCPAVAFIAARGSGQNLGLGGYSAGLGSRGAAVLKGLRQRLGLTRYELPAIAVDYPAAAITMGTTLGPGAFPGEYRWSLEEGVIHTRLAILRSIIACPDTRLVLFGYSQGAHVIGDAFSQLDTQKRNHIDRVILLADAAYRPDDDRVAYRPARLRGVGIKGARAPFPRGDAAIIESWCWDRDAVCQRPPAGSAFHGEIYAQYEANAAESAAQALARFVSRPPS